MVNIPRCNLRAVQIARSVQDHRNLRIDPKTKKGDYFKNTEDKLKYPS